MIRFPFPATPSASKFFTSFRIRTMQILATNLLIIGELQKVLVQKSNENFLQNTDNQLLTCQGKMKTKKPLRRGVTS